VYLELPDSKAYAQPYDWESGSKSRDCTIFMTRSFIVTTRDVKLGDEILVDYGPSYYKRHGLRT
jgi:hypothetical protein